MKTIGAIYYSEKRKKLLYLINNAFNFHNQETFSSIVTLVAVYWGKKTCLYMK
jgi:hypothetical protein